MNGTKTAFTIAATLLLAAFSIRGAALEVTQTDWSGGPADDPTAPCGTNTFLAADDVSWLAIPGQLSLSSDLLASPSRSDIDLDVPGVSETRACDMNGDGLVDVMANSFDDGRVYLWLNTGSTASRWERHRLPGDLVKAQTVHPADLDGDGLVDLLAGAVVIPNLICWRNTGGDPEDWERIVIDDTFNGHQIVTDDIDGDGRADIVAASQSQPVVWYRNTGGSPADWPRAELPGGCAMASSVWTADLDGNGAPDILAAGCDDEVVCWYGDGGDPVGWTLDTVDPDCVVAHWITGGDLDGDGDIDLVSAEYGRRAFHWYRNDGGFPVSWSRTTLTSTMYGALVAKVADLDGDGDLDILGQSAGYGRVSLWKNTFGDGSVWSLKTITNAFTQVWPLDTGDLDNDGDLDVLAGSNSLGDVAWWRACAFRSEGTLTGAVIDTGERHLLRSIDWSGRFPVGTAATFQVRAADDPDAMDDWSDQITAPGTTPGVAGRYLQYRVTLSTSYDVISPVVDEVSFELGTATAVSSPFGQVERLDASCAPNPARGRTWLEFTLPEAGDVTISIYSPNGRLVREVARRRYDAGPQRVGISGLSAGVYLCRVAARGEAASRRLVVLE